MATKKLNKSAQWEMVQAVITSVTTEAEALFKKDKSSLYNEMLLNELAKIMAPKQGGGTSTKLNDRGEVYCNYFEAYFPASEFNTKLSKPNKTTGERTEGYKANCKTAETILRKIKALKANVTKQTTEAFRAKHLTEEEFDAILNKLDEVAATKYETLEDIPTAADVVGLTEAMAANVDEQIETEEDLMALADDVEANE